jgi:hypothetical protein
MTRSKFALVAGVAVLGLIAAVFGQEATPTTSEAPKSKSVFYESPKGSYRLERSPDNKSVWVVSAKDPKKHQILAGVTPSDEYLDPDRYNASPDEKWLVAETELYQQISPLKFVVFRKKGWFKSNLESFVENSIQPPSNHWIWTLGGWSDDSSQLTISISWPEVDGKGEANMAFNARSRKFERLP